MYYKHIQHGHTVERIVSVTCSVRNHSLDTFDYITKQSLIRKIGESGYDYRHNSCSGYSQYLHVFTGSTGSNITCTQCDFSLSG